MPTRAQKPDRYRFMVWIKGTRMADGARFIACTDFEAKEAASLAFDLHPDNLEVHRLGEVDE